MRMVTIGSQLWPKSKRIVMFDDSIKCCIDNSMPFVLNLILFNGTFKVRISSVLLTVRTSYNVL